MDQTRTLCARRVRQGRLLIPSRVRRDQGRDSPDRGESSDAVPSVVTSMVKLVLLARCKSKRQVSAVPGRSTRCGR
jgi:hypothetical protein